MKTSQKGLDLIKDFEGQSNMPYLDITGLPTIGWGTTVYPSGNRVKMTDNPITSMEAEGFLRHDLEYFEKQVGAMTRDDITQNQFDALVSFAYNLGSNALKGSTLLKKVNANPNDKSIAQEFSKWVYASNKKLPGLIKRRSAESKLYFTMP